MLLSDELIREYERRQVRKKFNILGFSVEAPYSNWRPTKHCVYHPGTRLIQNFDENGKDIPGLMCPSCGSRYTEKESPLTEEGIKGKFSGQTKPRIISAKSSKKKKYYDKHGHEINDPDLIQIAKQGGSIISYYEEKQGEVNSHH